MAAAGDPANPRQLWLAPQGGERRTGLVAEVVVATRSRATRAYAVPEELRAELTPGSLVQVPQRRAARPVPGLCVAVSEQPWDHTRPAIQAVTGRIDWLSPTLIELGLWLADYYAASLWQAFEALAPVSLRSVEQRTVTYLRLALARSENTSDSPADSAMSASAPAAPPATTPVAAQTESPAVYAAASGAGGVAGVPGVAGAAEALEKSGDTGETQSRPGRALTSRQRAVLEALHEGPLPPRVVSARTGAGPSTLRTLERRGLVVREARCEPFVPTPPDSAFAAGPEDAFALMPGQVEALAAIGSALADGGRFGVYLLFGVPGSGKTEVYVRAIRAALAGGRQAIVLIPEIALATQIVTRLARRFPRVAVLHSQLGQRARRRTLAAVADGLVDVVIGTRTAVFAPCPRLGLIVVDEEQEGSLKNLTAPHYHARDVAIKRAQLAGIPVVLGSATPALETWHNAQSRSHYRLLRLPERVGFAELPQVEVVRHDPRAARVLSPALEEQLRNTLAQGRQALLLHNRRGYAVHLRCRRCGLLVACPRCGAALVEHRSERICKCHRCGLREPPPAACLDDTCRGELERTGLAVQRLEEELGQRFPAARLLRLDADTMRRRQDYEEALRRFEAREADILLGTQMVAKGLDFPAVRLAAVIDADAGLALPDFRAAERVFQLIVQVVGRAGRRAGESLALIQTADDQTPAIRHALRLDYESFADSELSLRRRLGLPPWTRLARIVLADPRAARAGAAAEQLAHDLTELAARVRADLRVDAPGPCVIARRGERFRHQVLVRGPRGEALSTLLRLAAQERRLRPPVERLVIDVDPLDLF